jgi:Rad3-related DNA helicase
MDYWFPYKDPRKYQKRMMDLIYGSLLERKHCIMRAPTGIGKTISVLSSALKFAKERGLKILYLTNKSSGQKQPLKEFHEIKKKFDKDNKMMGGRIISKKDLCKFKKIKELDSESFYNICKRSKEKECKFYKKFKKELMKKPKKLKNIFGNDITKFLDMFELRDEIEDYCPYYSIKTYLKDYADFIVLDYNYVLSPYIRKGFFEIFDPSKCIVIFDECHSLPEKCQQLSSIRLSSSVFLACIDEIDEHREEYVGERLSEKDEDQIDKEIDETIQLLETFQEVVEYIVKTRRKNEVPFNLEKIQEISKKTGFEINRREIGYAIDVLSYFAEIVLEEKRRSRCLSLTNFLKLLLDIQEDQRFLQFVNVKKYNDRLFSYLNIHCLDPSYLFKEILDTSYTVIGFSGTLFLEEFKKIMEFPEDTMAESIPNPFSTDQRKVLVFPKQYANFTLKTRNKDVDFKANQIREIINSMKGNVLVVFPSTDVFNIYVPKIKERLNKTVYLRPFSEDYLDGDDYKMMREDILRSFKDEDNAVLFSIAFGSYNEGVDFIGCLQNVIIVGFPYPGITYQRQKLEEFFTNKFQNKDYARFLVSMLPGLEKSIQSAGRPIRSYDDRAVVVFYGKQFGPGIWKYHKFLELFPEDLKEQIMISTEFSELIDEINSFEY